MAFEKFLNGLADKRIAVVGMGISNTPLIELLAERGMDLTVCDKRSAEDIKEYSALSEKGVKFKLGVDYIKDLDCDIVFRTPGLHPRFLDEVKAKGAVITSEMEAFFELCPCRIIAVTGSDGKTTTTTLISELLKAEGYTVHLGGNIGRPLLCDVPKMKPSDFAVLELSSFQLHSMKCKPDAAVITNISPNHLDVHPNYNDYIEAKCSIFRMMGECDRLVLNFDNDITSGFAARTKAEVSWFSRKQMVDGYYVAKGAIYKESDKIIDTSEILLPGEHNVENLMAAFAATDGLVSRETFRKVAREFSGVAHRLELVRTLNGVRYYNDSIASSPTRTIAGLKCFKDKIILIAGGYDKNIPYGELGEEIIKYVKKLYLTGNTAQKIYDAVVSAPGYSEAALPIQMIDDFRETVLTAASGAEEGDCVVLSPASASFDKFKNFEERGNTFRKIVEEM